MSICTAPGRVSTSSAQTFRHPNASPSSALDRLPDLTVTQWWRLFHSGDPGQSLFTHNLGFDRCQLDFQPTVGEHDVDGASRLQAERHAELLGYDEASCRVDGSSHGKRLPSGSAADSGSSTSSITAVEVST